MIFEPFSKRYLSDQPDVCDLIRRAFPSSIREDVNTVLSIVPSDRLKPAGNLGRTIINKELLEIPYRFYSSEPRRSNVEGFSIIQNTVLECLYTRHHNGFVRQKYLGRLILSKELWVVPYILQLIGEYVIEIIQMIEANMDFISKEHFFIFATENPEIVNLTRRRVIDYWNCYFRWQFPHFSNYPGYTVLNRLIPWDNHSARKILKK
jgi:hypothetical protein